MKGQIDSGVLPCSQVFVPLAATRSVPRALSTETLREIETPLRLAAQAASHQMERLRVLKEELSALALPHAQALLTELGEGSESLAGNLARAADLLSQHCSAGTGAVVRPPPTDPCSAPDLPGPAPMRGRQSLAEALQGAVKLQAVRFGDRPIGFALDIQPGLDAMLDADGWSQVFAALVANSAQHGFRGRRGGQIRVTARCLGSHLLRLTYEDNGIGLSAAAREHAFRRRYTSRAAEGHRGLGLCTVRDIVHARLNGAIALLEAPIGAAFAIDVPAGPPEPLT